MVQGANPTPNRHFFLCISGRTRPFPMFSPMVQKQGCILCPKTFLLPQCVLNIFIIAPNLHVARNGISSNLPILCHLLDQSTKDMNFEKDSVKTCEFLQIAKFQLTDILYTPVQKKTPKFQQNMFGTRNFSYGDVSMTFTCSGLMTVPINNKF